MVNGRTPALESGNGGQIILELGTVLFALRRLRADLASGRLTKDKRLLSVGEIDKLLVALRPPARSPQSSMKKSPRFHRSTSSTAGTQRSTKNWHALVQAVG